uniref:Uncharacterized protein n=1 Tax=Fagus sylvatica TaxID=28930 RepID=A0A2N9G9V4_FAGSY
MFTAQSQARLMQIHYHLSTLRKAGSPIANYFHTFTGLVDTLAAIDQPLPEFQLVSFLLASLRLEYDTFVTSVQQRSEPVTLDYLYRHLLNHEIRLEQNQPFVDISAATTNFASHGSFLMGDEEDALNPPTPLVVVLLILPITKTIVVGGVDAILPVVPDLFASTQQASSDPNWYSEIGAPIISLQTLPISMFMLRNT